MLDALPLENIASFGADIDGHIGFIWWIVAGWLIVAEAALVYALVCFRKKDGVRASWLPGRSNRAMACILVPTLLVSLFDFAIEAQSATVWDKVKTDIPPHELLVRITGRQFVWSFAYAGADGELDTADDLQTVTELHVPQGKVVRFQLEALDVLHAFWVPALRLKQDAVPGRSIPGWFDTNKSGRFEIACAELCGASHTQMRGVLVVHPPDEFDKWVTQQRAQQQQITRLAGRTMNGTDL